MNELLETLKEIVKCCDGNELIHEQIYHIANDAIKKYKTKQLDNSICNLCNYKYFIKPEDRWIAKCSECGNLI